MFSVAFLQGFAWGFLARVAVVILGFSVGLILGGRKQPLLPYGSMPPSGRKRRTGG